MYPVRNHLLLCWGSFVPSHRAPIFQGPSCFKQERFSVKNRAKSLSQWKCVNICECWSCIGPTLLRQKRRAILWLGWDAWESEWVILWRQMSLLQCVCKIRLIHYGICDLPSKRERNVSKYVQLYDLQYLNNRQKQWYILQYPFWIFNKVKYEGIIY